MRHKSVTIDEMMYIGTGYYHLETGDFHLNMTNPPLIKMVSAVPLLFLHPKPVLPPIEGDIAKWPIEVQWHYLRAFLYDNVVDADRMLFFARLPIVAIGVVLGAYVFRWSYLLYGRWGALLATFCYALSPNLLAHTRIAAQDFGVTATMFITSYYFWSFLKRPRWSAIVLTGVFAGLAAATKTSSLFLAPAFVLVVLLHVLLGDGIGVFAAFPGVKRVPETRIRSRQLLSGAWAAVVVAAVALFALNAVYGFQGFPAFFSEKGDFAFLAGIPIPIPQPLAELLSFQARLTEGSGGVYFAGKLYEHGLWYLMLAAMLLKTPLAGVILIICALAGFFWRFTKSADEWIPAIVVAAVLFVFSYLANINQGIRYILPVYPFLHVLIGRIARSRVLRNKAGVSVLAVLLGWYAWSSLHVYPHYLAHFNELIGGPSNGYKYLVDSNLDWGQDLGALKKYMDEHGIDRIKLAYFGSVDADYYGINYDFLPSVGLAPKKEGEYWWHEEGAGCTEPMEAPSGVVAVSAMMRASPSWLTPKFGECYEWARQREPVDQVGYSILIYRND